MEKKMKESEHKTIGARIRLVRKRYGMAQNEFAKEVGVTPAAISRLENNHCGVSLPLIKLICIKYGISEKWLLTGKGRMPAPPYAVESLWVTGKINVMEELSKVNDLITDFIHDMKERGLAAPTANPPDAKRIHQQG